MALHLIEFEVTTTIAEWVEADTEDEALKIAKDMLYDTDFQDRLVEDLRDVSVNGWYDFEVSECLETIDKGDSEYEDHLESVVNLSPTKIRKEIEGGSTYWNIDTKELVFYQPEFDDEDCTFTLGRACWNDKLGIQADHIKHDGEIEREHAARRIANEKGWLRDDDPLTKWYGPRVLKGFDE